MGIFGPGTWTVGIPEDSLGDIRGLRNRKFHDVLGGCWGVVGVIRVNHCNSCLVCLSVCYLTLMALLFRNLRVHQVFGANTDVGKTILTSGLVRASAAKKNRVFYLKPVSTGPLQDADDE